MQRENRTKRAKERTILEAFEAVTKWRKNYKQKKCSLEDAANDVGIPKKTLEDYNLIFTKLKITQENIYLYNNQKMGTLRTKIKNLRQNEQQIDEEIFRSNSPQQFTQINQNQQNIYSNNENAKNWSDMEIVMDDPNDTKLKEQNQNQEDSPIITEDD